MKNKSDTAKKTFFSLLIGVALLTITAIAFISVITFNPDDPNFNNISSSEPTNFFGSFGAITADMMLQLFGYGSYLIITIPFIWALQSLTYYDNYNFFVRFFGYLATTPLFLAFISAFATSPEWIFISYGGTMGNLLYIYFLNLHIEQFEYFIFSGFVISLYFALGFRADLWVSSVKCLASFVWSAIYRSLSATKFAIIKLFRLREKLINNDDNSLSIAEEDSFDEISEEKVPALKKQTLPATKPKAKLGKISNSEIFKLPDVDLLNKLNISTNKKNLSPKQLEANSNALEEILKDFGVRGEIVGAYPGPVVTLYEFSPAAGTKSSRVIGLADDIARTMCANSARLSVIPGKNSIGIELPNDSREVVYLREMIENDNYAMTSKKLPIILGKDISGNAITADLASMPHLLVAGTTGSGKSVAINTMILSLLYKLSPEECKFIMIDPKMLELSIYDGIPHLLSPVVTEPNKAVTALKWVVREMENRYRLMSHVSVRNIDGYNQKIKQAIENNTTIEHKVQIGFDPETGKPQYESREIEKKSLPYIVVIVDEMADLMIVAGKEIEGSIQRLAQMARAAGIHIIMATQRPSVDVITGVIKANFPTRISFHVTSKIDSRTILGEMGAEQLLGKGDMLFMSGGSKIKRVHGPFVDDKEVENVVKYLKNQSQPDYSVDITEEDGNNINDVAVSEEGDDLYKQAVELVIREGKASTSFLQRYFKIGYNRAASIIDEMERNGVVSPANHVGRREILVGKGNEI